MSPALMEPPPMARKKTPSRQVRVAEDVAQSADVVAACRGQVTSDLLTEILRPILARMEAEELAKRVGGGEPRAPKKGGK